MTDDLADLLGESTPTAPPPKKRGRPTREMVAAREAEKASAGEDVTPDHQVNLMNARQLGLWFRMEAATVLKRLADCPVRSWSKNVRGRPTPLYDRVEAASYLVKPRIDLVRYLSSLNSNNIPPHINKTYWDAMNARAKYEANARMTWRDEDVLEVLGSTAILIREVSLLWIDQLPDKVSLSEENHKALRVAVSDMLEQVKKRLEDMPKERRTQSVIAQLEQHLEGGINVDGTEFLIGDYSDAAGADDDEDLYG